MESMFKSQRWCDPLTLPAFSHYRVAKLWNREYKGALVLRRSLWPKFVIWWSIPALLLVHWIQMKVSSWPTMDAAWSQLPVCAEKVCTYSVVPSTIYVIRSLLHSDLLNLKVSCRCRHCEQNAQLLPLAHGHLAVFQTTSDCTEIAVLGLTKGTRYFMSVRGHSRQSAVEHSEAALQGLHIVASVAVSPQRHEAFADAVLSIYPYVPEIRAFMNQAGYMRDPSGASRTAENFLCLRRGPRRRRGQWQVFWVGADSAADYQFAFENDIVYPPDYVPVMVAKMRQYRNSAVVGVHCILFRQPFEHYYDLVSRWTEQFTYGIEEDHSVHVLGTGTVAYPPSVLNLSFTDFAHRNMADLWLAKRAVELNVSRVCVSRKTNWLTKNVKVSPDSSIYNQSAGGTGLWRDTSDVQDFVSKRLYPLTILPVAGRKKIIMAVTTYNRLEFLRHFIDGWLTTRSTAYDWVLIVADDGSTDGTREYLHSLRVPGTEVHTLLNRQKYACGQFNTILKVASKIGFHLMFKVEDDVVFRKPGWDQLYVDAVTKGGRDHLCYLNIRHRSNLVARQHLAAMLPPVSDPSGLLQARVTVKEADGPFFTVTERMIADVGFCDEDVFKVRGQWHLDLSMRYCRAGHNTAETFFDAKGSNDYIGLQVTLNPKNYRAAIPFNDAYKWSKRKDVMDYRYRVMLNESRVYVAPPREEGLSSGILSNIVVLNLRGAEARYQCVSEQLAAFGLEGRRLEAEDGRAGHVYDEWVAYNATSLPPMQRGLVRNIRSSKQFYQDYENQRARAVYKEDVLGRRPLTSGGFGYSLTWRKALLQAMVENQEHVVLLDDDVRLHKNFANEVGRIMGELPANWSIVYLGAIQWHWSEDWVRWYNNEVYMGDGSSIGSHAVLLRSNIYPEILNHISEMELPVDDGALSAVCRAHKDRCFTLYPNMVIQDLKLESQIKSTVNQSAASRKMKAFRWDEESYTNCQR